VLEPQKILQPGKVREGGVLRPAFRLCFDPVPARAYFVPGLAREGQPMTEAETGDPVLAADFSASGLFTAVGTVHAPGAGFAAAIRDFGDVPSDPGLLQIALYAVVSNAFGVCSLRAPGIAPILRSYHAGQLAAEWRIDVPALGRFQALFTVARFEPVHDDGLTFALTLRLAGKPWFAPPGKLEV
jgi:hypothetical protein